MSGYWSYRKPLPSRKLSHGYLFIKELNALCSEQQLFAYDTCMRLSAFHPSKDELLVVADIA